jgi:hypothetical protein
MKIRRTSFFLGLLQSTSKSRLSIHGSNLNSIFVIMSELKVLNQNFNTMDLIKFLEKNRKTSHLDYSSHIEGDIM